MFDPEDISHIPLRKVVFSS